MSIPSVTTPLDDTTASTGHRSRLRRRSSAALAALVVAVSAAVITPSLAAFNSTTANSTNSFSATYWGSVLDLAAGSAHTCAVDGSGAVACWGRNDKGQLGDGTTASHNVPVEVLNTFATALFADATAVAAGGKNTCALRNDATVWCWGDNPEGQVGNGTQVDANTPRVVSGPGGVGTLSGAANIAVGLSHACAARTDGTVWCWGRNDKGQLGNPVATRSTTPVQVTGPGGTGTLTGVTRIAAGSKHTCAVKSDGTAWCWGDNPEGQLGNGTQTDSFSPVQVLGVGAVGVLSGGLRPAAGASHSCVTRSDGSLWCWGRNDKGQLGNPVATRSTTPVAVTGAGGVGTFATSSRLAAGLKHTCATRTDLTTWCWGDNPSGQLGNGTTADSFSPVQVVGAGGIGVLAGAVVIAAGDSHGCAALSDGTLRCWGLNADGQLGDSTNSTSSTPVSVSGIDRPDMTFVALDGGVTHTCAVNDLEGAWCWGRNDKGQLGIGNTADSDIPVEVLAAAGSAPFSGASTVASGAKHNCAVKTDGTAWCWGDNPEGQLGIGNQTDRSRPTQVVGAGGTGTFAGAADVAAGLSHSCAARTDGTVWCWGRNDQGQLGNPVPTRTTTPVQVTGPGGVGTLGDVIRIRAEEKHTCAVKSDGTVWCWGDNPEGQLGNGTQADSFAPVQVLGPGGVGFLGGASDITVGQSHSCAAMTDSTVWCWGRNDQGQLGNPVATRSTTPVQVTGPGGVGILGGAARLGAGLKHTCASRSDGTAWCWGDNPRGQLGNGTTADSFSPVQVVGTSGSGTLADALLVGAGDSHSCAPLSSQTVRCWGHNVNGQLGNNTTTDSVTPVRALGI